MPLAANKQIKFSTLTSRKAKNKKFSHPEKEISLYAMLAYDQAIIRPTW